MRPGRQRAGHRAGVRCPRGPGRLDLRTRHGARHGVSGSQDREREREPVEWSESRELDADLRGHAGARLHGPVHQRSVDSLRPDVRRPHRDVHRGCVAAVLPPGRRAVRCRRAPGLRPGAPRCRLPGELHLLRSPVEHRQRRGLLPQERGAAAAGHLPGLPQHGASLHGGDRCERRDLARQAGALAAHARAVDDPDRRLRERRAVR
jgi:hypothetical protein